MPYPMLKIDEIQFNDVGLVPAIVQDQNTGEVLMLAYMNRESLKRTIETGETWFFSRSRQELWNKGATSGDRQRLKWLRVDCDADTLLVGVEQLGGGACHVAGERSCFFSGLEGAPTTDREGFEIVPELARLIAKRHREMPEGSYTTTLLRGGVDRAGKKVGEEAVEVVIAAKNRAVGSLAAGSLAVGSLAVESGDAELALETADLLYHLLVLAECVGLTGAEVFEQLSNRRSVGRDN